MSEVLYQQHPAMFRNSPIGFVIAICLTPFGIGIIILMWWYLSCRSTLFTITTDRVEVERGLLSKNRTDLAIRSIRTTNVAQSFGQRLFGVGDIQIYTAGDAPEMTLSGLKEPLEIRNLLQHKIENA